MCLGKSTQQTLLLTLVIALIMETRNVEGSFPLLVFGGFNTYQDVQLYETVFDTSKSCSLPPLLEEGRYKPFGGLMDGNMTVCAGGLYHCYYLITDQQGELTWVQSVYFKSESSSLITTYDNEAWTFFSGYYTEDEFHTWTSGMAAFEEHELDFEFPLGACSARRNQTHAIVSRGSRDVLWFQEEGNLVQKWDEGSHQARLAACGLVFDKELGYLFVTAGGLDEDDYHLRTVDIFSFADHSWLVGQELVRGMTQSASIAFQNTFFVVGGKAGREVFDTLLKFDFNEGWIELPMRLKSPDFNVGVMRPSPGTLQCT